MIKEIIKVKNENDVVSYEKLSIENYEGFGGERALSHSFVMDVLRKIMGKTLTVIDASINDKQQNKAIKDLLRGIISDEMEFAADWAFDQDSIMRIAGEAFDEGNTGVSTVEEALGVK